MTHNQKVQTVKDTLRSWRGGSDSEFYEGIVVALEQQYNDDEREAYRHGYRDCSRDAAGTWKECAETIVELLHTRCTEQLCSLAAHNNRFCPSCAEREAGMDIAANIARQTGETGYPH